jgi:hypothetical protein
MAQKGSSRLTISSKGPAGVHSQRQDSPVQFNLLVNRAGRCACPMPMNHHEYETNVAEMALTGEGVMGPPGEKRHSVSHVSPVKSMICQDRLGTNIGRTAQTAMRCTQHTLRTRCAGGRAGRRSSAVGENSLSSSFLVCGVEFSVCVCPEPVLGSDRRFPSENGAECDKSSAYFSPLRIYDMIMLKHKTGCCGTTPEHIGTLAKALSSAGL